MKPEIDADGFQQITNEVRLEGDGIAVSRQFRDGVLHPVVRSLAQDQGGKAVAAFLSCVLLQAALDLRALLGAEVATAAMDEVRAQLAAQPVSPTPKH